MILENVSLWRITCAVLRSLNSLFLSYTNKDTHFDSAQALTHRSEHSNTYTLELLYLDGVFIRVAEIDRLGVVSIHQSDQPLHQIVHVLERTGLFASAVNGDIFSL